LKYYTESGIIKNITLSLYDTYGPNDNRPKFINLVIDALDKDVPFNMSPGNQEIRYVYIDDVVNAYCIALDLLMGNKIDKSETFSISGNESMSLNELVEYVSNTVGKKIETNPGFYNYRDREIMKCIPKFNKIPNWEAKVKLSEGIKQIIQNNENRRN
jgi:nucleoside-diphosphate-sugar epimerase